MILTISSGAKKKQMKITSNKYLSQPYGEKLRKIFLEKTILHIINFRLNVFEATVDPAITCVKKEKSITDAKLLFKDISNLQLLVDIDRLLIFIFYRNLFTLISKFC